MSCTLEGELEDLLAAFLPNLEEVFRLQVPSDFWTVDLEKHGGVLHAFMICTRLVHLIEF